MTKKVITGNYGVAYAAVLAGVKVVPVYPITPQTTIVEKLIELAAKEGLDIKFIYPESEHSAMAVCIGASAAGVRTFTATSSQGLVLMHEMLFGASGLRLPIVMANCNRGLWAPWNLWADQTDSLAQRDTGWLQFYCESGQEALDTTIQAFRIAEDKRVLLPTMVNSEGYILTSTFEPVDIPEQKLVDKYLPMTQPLCKLQPSEPFSLGVFASAEVYMAMKYKTAQAMKSAAVCAKEANQEFERLFGRSYGDGLIERYGAENPDIVLVTAGTIAGTIKEVINDLDNKDVGLLRIRMFCPFPEKEVIEQLEDVKKVAVIDRNSAGVFCQELKAVMQGAENPVKIYPFIAGVGGVDVTPGTILKILNHTSKNSQPGEPVWMLGEIKKQEIPSRYRLEYAGQNSNGECLFSGHTACPGCGAAIAIRHIAKTLGQQTIGVIPACCWTPIGAFYPVSAFSFPVLHTAFETTAAVASGIKAGLSVQGDKETVVFGLAGDGGTYNIGLQALSSAAERNENIIYICYNNEAYMNTGNQASGATPYGAWTMTTLAGKRTRRKNMPEIMAAHRIPYVFTASISDLEDLERKIRRAIEINKAGEGLVYGEVLCPCSPGWRFPQELTVKLARLAVETGVWLLYEVENGEKWIIRKPKFLPVEEYLKLQGRFKHLKKEDVEIIQKDIYKEWAYLRNKP